MLNELNLVQGVIEKKSTIPILSNILLEAAEGNVAITATDLDVSICCGCAAEVETAGMLTVSARRLFDIVRLLPEESEIRITLLENDWVKLKAGKSEYKVVGLPRENFPSIPQAPCGRHISACERPEGYDPADHVCHHAGGIPVLAEWSPAGSLSAGDAHGGDGRASVGPGGQSSAIFRDWMRRSGP